MTKIKLILLFPIPWSIQVSFITITTECSSNSIYCIVFPDLMLASHGNVNLLTDWLKADIPWRVKELEEDIKNFNIMQRYLFRKFQFRIYVPGNFYYSSTRSINTSEPKLMKHTDMAYTRSLITIFYLKLMWMWFWSGSSNFIFCNLTWLVPLSPPL